MTLVKNIFLKVRKNGSDGGCSACSDVLSLPAIPAALTGTKTVLLGGIAGWVAMRSDLSFTDITAQSEWEGYIDDGTMTVRLNGCRVKGDKPESTVVERLRGACSNSEVVKRSQVWSIEDVGNDDDFTMHALYDYFRENWRCYRWAFITCDYRLYGFIPGVTAHVGKLMSAPVIAVDDVIPQTSEDDAMLKMVVTTQESGLIIPISLPILPAIAGIIN